MSEEEVRVLHNEGALSGAESVVYRWDVPHRRSMDRTSHISSVTLFHYLIHAMPLSDDERNHLAECYECQSVLEEWDTYVDPGMIHAA